MDFFQFTKKRVKPPTLIVDDVRLVECVSRCVNRSVQFVVSFFIPVGLVVGVQLVNMGVFVLEVSDPFVPFPLCCRSVVLYVGGIFPVAVLVVVVVRWVSAV